MVSTISSVNAQIAKCESILSNPNIPEEKRYEAKQMLENLNLLKQDLDPASDAVSSRYNPGSDQFTFSQKSDEGERYQPKNIADGVLLMTNPLAYAIMKKGGGQPNSTENGQSGAPKNFAEGALLVTNPLAYAIMKNVNPFS